MVNLLELPLSIYKADFLCKKIEVGKHVLGNSKYEYSL